MQALLASLAIGLQVKDGAYKAGMSAARADAKRTGQDFEREGARMSGAIEDSARAINRAFVTIAEQAAAMSASVMRSGIALTAAVTAPILLVGRSMGQTASSFEAAMKRVKSAMLSASPDQIEKLSAAALEMGPAMGRSAIEAAGAIEMLAKNGMSAATILNGGLNSALTLATVGQTDLARAADLTTDIMTQFKQSSRDLPNIVNKVAGALDASKLGFESYQLAIGQAGGIAGALGYTFDDLNTALAATVPSFASGSDAGTSFKVFLTSLVPVSKQAAEMQAALGLEFFKANGQAKSLGEVADELNRKMSNLNDRAKNDAASTMFGTDGMRTALALMDLGADGIANMQRQIDAITADDKLKVLLDGDAAASARLSSESEKLAVKLGSVLLPVWAGLKNAIADVAAAFASLPGWMHNTIVVTGLMAASIGPLILAATTLAKVALPLLLLRLGPVALGFAAIVNPLGVVIRLLGQLALQAGAASMLGLLGTRMIALAGPIGMAVSVLLVLIPLLGGAAEASDEAKRAQEGAAAAYAAAVEQTDALANASGKLRLRLLEEARASRVAARDAMTKARADATAALAALKRARSENASGLAAAAQAIFLPGTGPDIAAAKAEFDSRMATFGQMVDKFDLIDRRIKEAETQKDPALVGLPSTADEKKPGKSKGDGQRDRDRFDDDMGQLRVARQRAVADLTGSIKEQYDATMLEITEERAAFARQIAADDTLTAAKRAQLIAAKDAELEQREGIAERDRFNALEQEAYDLFTARNDAEQEQARTAIDLADSYAARRDGELRLLALQKEREAADLDLVLATKASTAAERDNALRRREKLDGIYDAKADQVVRDTESPAQRYMRELSKSAQAVGDDIEASAVSALDRLNDELADAVMGAGSLSKAFANMAQSIVRDLIRIGIQRAVIAPLADSLFGRARGDGEQASGSPFGSFLKGVGGFFGTRNAPGTPGYGGGKASGGRVGPGNWYMVGENGPEPFVPDTAGTIIPNGGLRAGSRGVVELRVRKGEMFETIVEGISGGVTVRNARESQQRSAMMQRQALV